MVIRHLKEWVDVWRHAKVLVDFQVQFSPPLKSINQSGALADTDCVYVRISNIHTTVTQTIKRGSLCFSLDGTLSSVIVVRVIPTVLTQPALVPSVSPLSALPQ